MHFKNGYKHADDGRVYKRLLIVPVPSSNGVGAHEVSFWADGSRSCDCTGWIMGKKRELEGRPRCSHPAKADRIANAAGPTPGIMASSPDQPVKALSNPMQRRPARLIGGEV